MAQLIVRKLEAEVVEKLRERAARHGVSTEEEHRRILRTAVLGGRGRRDDFKDFLAKIPDVGPDELFERPPAEARPVDL